MIQGLSAEEVEAGNRRFRESVLGAQGIEALKNAPRAVNKRLALSLVQGAPFSFRSMRFTARDVDVFDGLELQEIKNDFMVKADVPDDLEELLRLKAVSERLAAFYFKLSRPVLTWHRLLYRWLPNPFLRMTMAEAMELLSFFSARRMISSVRMETESTGSSTRQNLSLHK